LIAFGVPYQQSSGMPRSVGLGSGAPAAQGDAAKIARITANMAAMVMFVVLGFILFSPFLLTRFSMKLQ
jgi:hypothetical protein